MAQSVELNGLSLRQPSFFIIKTQTPLIVAKRATAVEYVQKLNICQQVIACKVTLTDRCWVGDYLKGMFRGLIKVVFRNLLTGTEKRKRNILFSVTNDREGNRNKNNKIQVQRHAVHSVFSVNFMIGLYIYIYKLLWSLYKPCHNFVSGSNKLEEEKGRTF